MKVCNTPKHRSPTSFNQTFLPSFLVLLPSLPTGCWHQEQWGTRASSLLLQLPAYQRHLRASCVGKDSRKKEISSSLLYQLGKGGKRGTYMIFSFSIHHSEAHLHTVWGQLVSLIRSEKQSSISIASHHAAYGSMDEKSHQVQGRHALLQAQHKQLGTGWAQTGGLGAFLEHHELHLGSTNWDVQGPSREIEHAAVVPLLM